MNPNINMTMPTGVHQMFLHKDFQQRIVVWHTDEDPMEYDRMGALHMFPACGYNGDVQLTGTDVVNLGKIIGEHKENGHMVFDLYKYEHGDVRFTLGPVTVSEPLGDVRWDMGRCGIVVVEKQDLYDRDSALKIVKAEIEDYTHYCNGEVYRAVLENSILGSGWEETGIVTLFGDISRHENPLEKVLCWFDGEPDIRFENWFEMQRGKTITKVEWSTTQD